METKSPITPPKPFFKWAARCSLAAPLITALFVGLIVYADNHVAYGLSYDVVGPTLGWGMLIVIGGLILGVISIFGLIGHGVPLMIWTAFAGILLSCAVGFGVFVLAIGYSMGRGC
jgi:hypothetical protein